jgi:hypothetical protein
MMPQILFKAALHTYGDGDGITTTASVVQCSIHIKLPSQLYVLQVFTAFQIMGQQ